MLTYGGLVFATLHNENAAPMPTAHPDLQLVYPPHILACILACVVATEHRLGAAAPLF